MDKNSRFHLYRVWTSRFGQLGQKLSCHKLIGFEKRTNSDSVSLLGEKERKKKKTDLRFSFKQLRDKLGDHECFGEACFL